MHTPSIPIPYNVQLKITILSPSQDGHYLLYRKVIYLYVYIVGYSVPDLCVWIHCNDVKRALMTLVSRFGGKTSSIMNISRLRFMARAS